MLFLNPLTGPEDFQTRAVDQQVDRSIRQNTAFGEWPHFPCSSAQSAVVRRAQWHTQQAEDGDHQPLGLAQRQVKCKAQHHARLDCKLGVAGLTAWSRPTSRLPPIQYFLCEP